MTGLERERKRVERLYREYEAILALLAMPTNEVKHRFDRTREDLAATSKKRAMEFASAIEVEIERLRKKYKICASTSELLKLREAIEQPPGQTFMIPLHNHRKYFRAHDDTFNMSQWPGHTLIEIDIATYRQVPGTFEMHLPEIIQYENVCALFNLAGTLKVSDASPTAKLQVKTGRALRVATVMTAFSFVEAYLNGIARNHYLLNIDELDTASITTLTEWDASSGKFRYLSLRDKVLKYPRIILGLEHSPIQENNCPEMKFIVESAKQFRDSVIHPGPAVYLEHVDKQIAFHSLDFGKVEEIVDSSISLVRRINLALGEKGTPLTWLVDRGCDGLFPELVFK